jgi:hypothetical protein
MFTLRYVLGVSLNSHAVPGSSLAANSRVRSGRLPSGYDTIDSLGIRYEGIVDDGRPCLDETSPSRGLSPTTTGTTSQRFHTDFGSMMIGGKMTRD